MNTITLEINKQIKQKSYLIPLVSIVFFDIVAYFLAGNDPRGKDFMTYTYYVFALNSKLIFPIIVAFFFVNVIVKEFENKTARIFFLKMYTREKAIIYKFVVASSIFTVIFVLNILVYEIILFLIFKLKGDSFFTVYTYTSNEYFIKLFKVVLLQNIFLNTFGLMCSLIGLATKKSLVSILISILLLIFDQVGGFVNIDSKYNFITAKYGYQYMLRFSKFDNILYLETILVNVITLTLFVIISAILVRKTELS